MTFAKATTVSLGLAGVFALGVWTGPALTRSIAREPGTPVVQVEQPVAPVETLRPATREARAVTPRATTVSLTPDATPAHPAVQRHAQSLLNSGANVVLAADGFRDAESFVTVAYAARNTGIPFVLLKHRVLTQGQTLSEAIRVSKPDLDAVAEMDRARTDARSALTRMGN